MREEQEATDKYLQIRIICAGSEVRLESRVEGAANTGMVSGNEWQDGRTSTEIPTISSSRNILSNNLQKKLPLFFYNG